jgi:hypothetical protein
VPKVERNHELYRKFEKAQELYDQHKQPEAQNALQDFLSHPVPYEFQAFYGLRKQAEEMLKMLRSQAEEVEIEQLLKKADTMVRMGQLNQARDICRTVLDINPTNESAKRKLDEVERMLGHKEIDTDELLKQIDMSSDAPGTEPGMKVPETIHYVEEPAPVSVAPPPPPSSSVAATPSYAPAAARPAARATAAPKAAGGPFGMSPFMVYGLGGAAALVILSLLLFVFWSPSDPDVPKKVDNVPQPADVKDTPTPPSPVVSQPISVSIDVRPWAELEISGKNLQQPVRGTTPVRVNLPAGEYSVVCTNPDFTSFTQTIRVSDASRTFRFEFAQLDANRIVDTLLR